MNHTCHYCSKSFEFDDLRPYGPGGAMICHPCGTAPERMEATKTAFLSQLDAVVALGAVPTIGTGAGPIPANSVLPQFPKGTVQ